MQIHTLIAQRPGLKPWLLLLLLLIAALATGPAAAADDPDALSPDSIMQAGHTGIGYVALNSVFGDSVIQHMYKPPGGVEVTGTDNGLVIAIGGFFAKIAFLIFAGFAATIATQLTVKGVQEGNFAGEGASIPLMFRWTTGIALAFPMPHLFGLALVQKLIIILAIASNGLANTAAMEITKAAYVSPIGADIAAGSLIPLPPNPSIDGPAEAAFLNVTARKMCAYHARSVGMSATETRHVCQGGTAKNAAGSAWVGGQVQGPLAQCEKAAEYGSLHKNLCETTSYALSEAETDIEKALELDDEKERVLAIKKVQAQYWQKLKQQRQNFDAALGGGSIDPLEHVTEIMGTAGWPGLALTYNKISSQIEAMQTTISDASGRTFNVSQLPELSRTGEDLRNRLHNSLSEYKAAQSLNETAGAWGATFEKEPEGVYETILSALAPAGEAAAAYASADNALSAVNSGAMWLASKEANWLAGFFTAGSGLEAAYDFAHGIIALGAAGAVSSDIATFAEISPASIATSAIGKSFAAVKGGADSVAERVGATEPKPGLFDRIKSLKTKPTAEGESESLVISGTKKYLEVLIFILIGCALILGVIVPKLPAILIAVVIMDWVLTLLVIFAAAPLWILMQLSGDNEDKSLITHQVKQGLRYLAWVLLYPTLIVTGVTVSLIIVNVSVPLVATFVLSSTSDGLMANAFFILSAPIVLMLAVTLIVVLSMNLIVKAPDQIAAFLSIQPFSGSMVTDAMGYIGAQRHIDQVQSKASIHNFKV